jgi:hypothetical protein
MKNTAASLISSWESGGICRMYYHMCGCAQEQTSADHPSYYSVHRNCRALDDQSVPGTTYTRSPRGSHNSVVFRRGEPWNHGTFRFRINGSPATTWVQCRSDVVGVFIQTDSRLSLYNPYTAPSHFATVVALTGLCFKPSSPSQKYALASFANPNCSVCNWSHMDTCIGM